MPGIVMNVGPNAIRASSGGASGGGGQTLGAAHGTITINVNNVSQANNILQQSARQINATLRATGAAARASAQVQIASARTAAANTASAASQIVSGHKVQASSYKLAATQAAATANTIISTNRQQASSANTLAAQQRQAHQQVMQPIQQQIAANRLIVSNLNAQAAQARATARAQRQAAQQSISAWQQFNKQLDTVKFEIAAVGVGAGLLAGSGIQYAASMQEAEIQLRSMTGSMEEGRALMEQLRDTGREAGVPFKDMLTFAVQLLPTLQKDTSQLERWFDITRRTAAINRGPTGGVAGATFSLREAFLSIQQGGRDFVSIADRFNISKIGLATAFEEALGDTNEEKFLNAMDKILNQMGFTTAAADEMGDTFNASFAVARDAALQAAGTGFAPFLGLLTATSNAATDFFGSMSQGAPSILLVAGGLTSAVAIGVPLLLLLNQLSVAWTAVGTSAQGAILRMGGLGATLLGVAAALDIGRGIGISIGNAVRTSRGQQAKTPEQVQEDLSTVLFTAAVNIKRAAFAVDSQIFHLAQILQEGAAAVRRALQGFYQNLADSTAIGPLKGFFQDLADRQGALAFDLENQATETENAQIQRQLDFYESLKKMAGDMGVTMEDAEEEAEKYTQKQKDRIVQRQQDIDELEANLQNDLMEQHADYAREISEAQRTFFKQQTREAEDFARQRANAERQYNESVQRVIEDSARQRAEWEEDLARTIAEAQEDSAERQADMAEDHAEVVREAQEDSAKRIADLEEENSERVAKERKDSLEKIIGIEEDYNRERQRAMRDHADNLFQAASQFDAFALAEEERRFLRERQEAAEDHKTELEEERDRLKDFISENRQSHQKALEEERENLAERLEDEQRSYDKRRKEEQEALAKSIEDNKEAHARRLEDQKENDELQLERMQKAFNDQQIQENIEYGIRRNRAKQDHDEQLGEMARVHGERIVQIGNQAKEERDKINSEFATDMIDLGVRLETFEEKMKGYEDAAITSFDNVWIHMLNQMALYDPSNYGPSTAPILPAVPGQFPTLNGGGSFQPPSSAVNGAGGTVNIYIYAQPGQSAEDIGKEAIDAYIEKLGPLYPY